MSTIQETALAPDGKYSCRVPKASPSNTAGQSYVIRHPQTKNDSLEFDINNDITTLYELFQFSRTQFGDQPFLGHRPFNKSASNFENHYQWETYEQIGQRVDNFASGLSHVYNKYVASGSSSSSSSDNGSSLKWPLGLYSVNRPEYKIAEYASYVRNLYNVALYDTLGESSVEYIMNHAEIPVIVCSLDKVPKLLKLASKMQNLKVIISMDQLPSSSTDTDTATATATTQASLPSPFNLDSINVLRSWSDSLGIKLLGFNEVESIGSKHQLPHIRPTPDDLAILCYTSGTTGTPKGAMSTHRNYSVAARASTKALGNPEYTVTTLSYLPLAHCYERASEHGIALRGGRIGFYCGDITRIVEDMQILKPTLFISVPRLLNRIYDKIYSATVLAPGLGGAIARKAVAVKLEKFHETGQFTHMFWDRVVFNKVKQVLGGNLDIIVSGSAPLEPKVMDFLRVAFCCPVVEGYGQTESSAISSYLPITHRGSGTIGVPFPGVEFMLVDVPEMNYHATDLPLPRGEICIRGGTVFTGYYKDPEKTKEVLTDDGWVRTGDIGQFNEDGTVTIIDRKKNIFKLSQGEYIAPEKLENIYSNNFLVQQIAVLGNSMKSVLVAVVVPDPETFVPWAEKILKRSKVGGITDVGDFAKLCRVPEIVKEVLNELTKSAKANNLAGFEYIKAVYLDSQPFDVETNGLLTPTMKLKRSDALKYYKKVMDTLYEGIENSGSTTPSDNN
ncbi:medium-chain fatty acid-CoA ligase faa2 [Mycoemilia scoparia]|uniref:Medium-chain fatty acid-CoA ligase faa2 n=1 Tax=Mycoemilia scoparia TaxID=417184 RepID=A0A9W7ZVJ4_9FUNG|nr:medium-chain fatty acid-CoA ligase faa2 [Mycoemilia scoparia]